MDDYLIACAKYLHEEISNGLASAAVKLKEKRLLEIALLGTQEVSLWCRSVVICAWIDFCFR